MSIESPRITTVIPTYRRPDMLRRAIQSVLAQTYEDFQVCVFDNASGDETAEVVAELARQDPRVKYFCHPENVGMLNNFNYALNSVRTPFFSLLCDDDLILPRFFQTSMKSFDAYPNAMAATGTILSADNEATWVFPGPRMPREGLYTPPESLLAWTHDRRPLITAHMFRREVIPCLGGFGEGITSDLDMELRCAAKYPYVVSYEPSAIVISHSSNWTALHNVDPKEWRDSFLQLSATLESLDIPADVLKQTQDTIKSEFGEALYAIGLLAISRGAFKVATACANELGTEYAMRRRSNFLKFMVGVTAATPPVHKLYKLMHAIRTKIKQRNMQELQQKVKEYMRTPSPEILF